MVKNHFWRVHMTIATSLDEKAKALAVDFLRTEGELLSVLMEMRSNRVFVELNYTGIFDYCERALRLSPSQSYYFKSVAEKAEEVPSLKTAVTNGSISLSQARRIVPVVTRENQMEWLEKAKKLSQKELEKEVTAVNPKAQVREKIKAVAVGVSELRVSVESETEENIKVLQDVLSQKLGHAATLSEVVAWMAKDMREKHDPIKKAERSVSLGNPENGKMTSGLRHRVNTRDGYQCSFVSADGRRCSQRRWLDAHHIVPRSQGGAHSFENLRLLCKTHHQWEHRGGAHGAVA